MRLVRNGRRQTSGENTFDKMTKRKSRFDKLLLRELKQAESPDYKLTLSDLVLAVSPIPFIGEIKAAKVAMNSILHGSSPLYRGVERLGGIIREGRPTESVLLPNETNYQKSERMLKFFGKLPSGMDRRQLYDFWRQMSLVQGGLYRFMLYNGYCALAAYAMSKLQ